MDIAKIWVEAALRLTKKDLKMMQRLIDHQNLKNIDMTQTLRADQDRRFDAESITFPFMDSFGNIVHTDRRSINDPRLNV